MKKGPTCSGTSVIKLPFYAASHPRRAQISTIQRRKPKFAHFIFNLQQKTIVYLNLARPAARYLLHLISYFRLTARRSACTLFVRWGAQYMRATLFQSCCLPPYSVQHNETDPEKFIGTRRLLRIQTFRLVLPCKLVNTDISEKFSAATSSDRPSKKESTNIYSHRRFGGRVIHRKFTSILVL